ncbi:MAG: hypothetical protein WD904_12725 [Dehalococcoidia bacterium]
MPEDPAPPPAANRRDIGVETIRTVTEETAQKLIRTIEGSQPIRRIRSSQIATAFLGTIGFALIIVGIERAASDIPIIENEWGSIVVGLILLAATGLLVRRMIG